MEGGSVNFEIGMGFPAWESHPDRGVTLFTFSVKGQAVLRDTVQDAFIVIV